MDACICFFQWEKAIFNYLIFQRNSQRRSKLCRNWNSFRSGCSWGESICKQPKVGFAHSEVSQIFSINQKQRQRPEASSNFCESDSLEVWGWGVRACVVLRHCRLSPNTLERTNFGFSKMICLIGKIWFHNPTRFYITSTLSY